jgi:hypothetical protein
MTRPTEPGDPAPDHPVRIVQAQSNGVATAVAASIDTERAWRPAARRRDEVSPVLSRRCDEVKA